MNAPMTGPEKAAHFARLKAQRHEQQRIRDRVGAQRVKGGMRVLHLRPSLALGSAYQQPLPKGGMTIAWRPASTKGNVIEVATAICHPTDSYHRKNGRYYATSALMEGHRIKLRVPDPKKVTSTLQAMFQPIVQMNAGLKPFAVNLPGPGDILRMIKNSAGGARGGNVHSAGGPR